jgi:hypothetical protein
LFWLVKEALPPWLFDLPELFPLATFVSPSVACGKDGSAAKRFRWHRTGKLKGTVALGDGPLEHGQRPEGSSPGDHSTVIKRASPERTSPTPLLNHETSDHLLSLRCSCL